MKTRFIYLVMILCSYQVIGQDLYGVTLEGGDYGAGTIYKTDENGEDLNFEFHFEIEVPGSFPASKLYMATNGKFYGVTWNGGIDNIGIIYEYNPQYDVYTLIYEFTYDNSNTKGRRPYGRLLQASNGKLYGTTSYGGQNNLGVLFEYDITSGIYTTKIHFEGVSNGSRPFGNLTEGSNGKLYGMTNIGGTYNYGIIYEYDTMSEVLVKKVEFDGTVKGRYPFNKGFLKSLNNKLYGVTDLGGSNEDGVFFEYNPETNSYLKLVDFDAATTGSGANSNVVETTSGMFYGLNESGGPNSGGVLFEYNVNTGIFTNKINFDYASETTGAFPKGGFLKASNGKLYGMTRTFLFEYDHLNDEFITKLDLEENGIRTGFGLTQSNNGKLYGLSSSTAEFDSDYSEHGHLFSFDVETLSYTKNVQFSLATKGKMPQGNLIQGANGRVYGITLEGGANNYGAIFEYNPLTYSLENVYDFEVSGEWNNNFSNRGNLMQSSNGNLYGMNTDGGDNDKGFIYGFNINDKIFSIIHHFDLDNGGRPSRDLIEANNGKLYGMTPAGGIYGDGVLFEYDIQSRVFTKKVDFNRSEKGQYPYGSLTQASNGKLYGLTERGGANNNGTLFEYDVDLDVFTNRFSFDYGVSGGYPTGSLIKASNGKLYGMSNSGGLYGKGTLFEWHTETNTFVKLLDFNNSESGSWEVRSLSQVSNDKIYGITTEGGSVSGGVLFEYDIDSGTYTNKFDFDGLNNGGYYPKGALLEFDPDLLSVAAVSNQNKGSIYPNPAKDVVNIGLGNGETLKEINIYNSLGQYISSSKFLKTTINHLERGVYFVEIETNKGKSAKKLFVK